jgi:hypothetical protein
MALACVALPVGAIALLVNNLVAVQGYVGPNESFLYSCHYVFDGCQQVISGFDEGAAQFGDKGDGFGGEATAQAQFICDRIKSRYVN